MEENNVKKKNNIVLYIAVVGIIVLIGIGISFYFYKTNINEKPIDNSTNVEEKDDAAEENSSAVEDKKYESSEAEKSLGLEYPYVIKENIKTTDGNLVGYKTCKLKTELYEKYNNKVCENNTVIYYSILNKKKSLEYDDVEYVDDKYVVAISYGDDHVDDVAYSDLLDIETGNVVKKLDYFSVSAKKINNKIYYVAAASPWDDDEVILDNNFNPIIKDIKSYAYVVNSDNTITIIPNFIDKFQKYNKVCDYNTPSKFLIYDLKGNKLYESKEYDHVVGIGKNSKNGYGYGDLLVVDNGNINIINYKENVIKTLIKGNICSVVDNQRIYVDDYSFYLDDGMYVYNRNNQKLSVESHEE